MIIDNIKHTRAHRRFTEKKIKKYFNKKELKAPFYIS